MNVKDKLEMTRFRKKKKKKTQATEYKFIHPHLLPPLSYACQDVESNLTQREREKILLGMYYYCSASSSCWDFRLINCSLNPIIMNGKKREREKKIRSRESFKSMQMPWQIKQLLCAYRASPQNPTTWYTFSLVSPPSLSGFHPLPWPCSPAHT